MTTDTNSSGPGLPAVVLTLSQLDDTDRAMDALKAVADILTSLDTRPGEVNIRPDTLSWMGFQLMDAATQLAPALKQIGHVFRQNGGSHAAA